MAVEEELTRKLNYCGLPSMTSYQQRPGGKLLEESFWRSYPSEEHPRAYVRAREKAGHRQEPFASALPPFPKRRFEIEIVVWRRIKH